MEGGRGGGGLEFSEMVRLAKIKELFFQYGFLRQYLQSSYNLGKVQNLGGPELSEDKIYCFIEERFHISFSHIFFC